MRASLAPWTFRRWARSYSFTLLAIVLLSGCGDAPPPPDPSLAIELRWIESYPKESRSDVQTGLLWTLSFLGAALPARGPDPLSWSGRTVTLRLDYAGLDAETLPRWRQLLALMKASEEYE